MTDLQVSEPVRGVASEGESRRVTELEDYFDAKLASRSRPIRQPFVGVHVSWRPSSVPRLGSACPTRRMSKTLRFGARCRTWPTWTALVSDFDRKAFRG